MLGRYARGRVWFPATVESVKEGKFDLIYDDGEREQKIFPRHVVSIEQFVPAEPEEIRGGDYVLAQKKADKAWYHGRVTTVRARTQDRRNATYDVALGDYRPRRTSRGATSRAQAHLADCEDAPDYSDGTNGCAYARAESRDDDWCAVW